MSKLFIVPVLCILLIAALAGCDSPQSSALTTAQSTADITLATSSPDSTDESLDTSSVDPEDTSTIAPDDTSSTSPTDDATPTPEDSSQPNVTTSPGATATPSSTAGTTETLKVKAITGKAQVTTTLSLRKSADASAEPLKKIPNDGTFTILSVNTDTAWLKVKYSGMDGYVLAKYVQVGSSATNKVCTVTSTTLNARSKASKTGKIIGILAKGDTLIVTSVVTAGSDTWYKVSVNGSSAYVNSKYCRLSTNS